MPSLSWNKIRENAILFSRDWAHASSEQADKQSFYNDFFQVFGLPLKTVASFEVAVQKLKGTYGFIDLLWRGTLLVEHKSLGANLATAETQAFEYIQNLLTVGRADEVPRYVLVSDFKRFVLYDLEPDDQLNLPLFRNRFRFNRTEFLLADFQAHIREFGFIAGYRTPPRSTAPQDGPNLRAVEIMAAVHDSLKDGGFTGHHLERFLVRVLFCLFADKTRIFEPDSFRLFIENRTSPDGSNLGAQLNELFATLDKPTDQRLKYLDEDLRAFPYVNGALFKERLDSAAFTSTMRRRLLDAANFDWSRISPAIFGALFQEIMKPKERRAIGAHYTSERDILKVIQPLFLDALQEEYETIRKDRSGRFDKRLEDFRKRLTQLKFLDPACGCGNFLVIAYRELRALELRVLQAQHGAQQAMTLDQVSLLSQVNVDQFYGIEIEEWPARIAEVALWLMDHQCNLRILEVFSQPYNRLPLKATPHIHLGNALQMDWNDLLPASDCSYVLGNPPFIGKSLMSVSQKADMLHVFSGAGLSKGWGVLDYVTAWYLTAAAYIQGTQIQIAFVSTNSISQGEQPSNFWPFLYKHGITINFAYQTFNWLSEARNKAHVHVVIIGFSQIPRAVKRIYQQIEGKDVSAVSLSISPYLYSGPETVVLARRTPICAAPRCVYGSKPTDGGNLLIKDEDLHDFKIKNPAAVKFIRRLISSDEYLDGRNRWCLWLEKATPAEINKSPGLVERLARVAQFRLASDKEATQELATSPSLFGEIRQPQEPFLLIPQHTSNERTYIPLTFFSAENILHNSCSAVVGADTFHFGILSSSMHIAWLKGIGGKIKSDPRYSITLVYNNFPWPRSSTAKQNEDVVTNAQAVLDARTLYPDSTLSELYDRLFTPPVLVKAHERLDRAVERCYRPEPFNSDRERVEFLFALYGKLSAPLLPAVPKPRKRAHKRTT